MGLQRRKQEMSIEKNLRRHTLSLSTCLSSNKFLGYSYDSLFQTAFTFEKADRYANSAGCCFPYPAPQTAIPLNGCTDFTAAWVRLREEGGGAVMQWYRGQPDKSRSPHMLGYYLQPITSLLLFWDLLGVPINLKCYCYAYRNTRWAEEEW